MTIALSEHRRIFRTGPQAVDVLMDRVAESPDLLIVLDEPATAEAMVEMLEYYLKLGAKRVGFTYNLEYTVDARVL